MTLIIKNWKSAIYDKTKIIKPIDDQKTRKIIKARTVPVPTKEKKTNKEIIEGQTKIISHNINEIKKDSASTKKSTSKKSVKKTISKKRSSLEFTR